MSDQDQTNQPALIPADVPHVEIPHVEIPEVPIPHMGTSTAKAPAATAAPPAPAAISQHDIDAAIAHVEQTGNTEGISPEVLVAACAQIEAQAAAQGIDLNAQAPNQGQNQGQPAPPQPGPGNAVDAAVVDKQSAFEAFDKQRDSLKEAVSGQRDALQKPYKDAMNKAAGVDPGDSDSEAMKALATAVGDLDPKTMALINAMSMISNNPGLLNGVVWLEVIQAIRNLIATETKHQIEAFMKSNTA